MRALTVQQPWAWAIINGGKLIENRTQLWQYRGPLAIHAGKTWSERGGASDLVTRAWNRATDCRTATQYSHLSQQWVARGVILGVVDLVDCHHAKDGAGCCGPWGEPSTYTERPATGEFVRRPITHLVLEKPRALVTPIRVTGQMGMWNLPADLIQQIEEGPYWCSTN